MVMECISEHDADERLKHPGSQNGTIGFDSQPSVTQRDWSHHIAEARAKEPVMNRWSIAEPLDGKCTHVSLHN